MPVNTPKPTKKSPAQAGSKPFNPSGDELEDILESQARADSVSRAPKAPKSPKPTRKARY